MRLGKSQGCTQYFHCTKGEGKRYIAKSDMGLVKELAQKSYNEKLLNYTERAVRQIEGLLKFYDDNEVEKIYISEHTERQKLITPAEPTYMNRLSEWLAKPYVGKGFAEGTPMIMSNSGLRVRSKSEKIMADYFESLGIPFKYECPVHLDPYGAVYPDFTFLSPITYQEIYWEHEGMMDNPEYAKSAVQKIELYEKNGIFPGDNLILTFETSASILNMDLVKELTRRYLSQ